MKIAQVRQYYPVTPVLKRFIKYFWITESDRPVRVSHKILPMNNIDFIINLSSRMQYDLNDGPIDTPGNCFFSGIRNRYFTMNQSGNVCILGVSFYPAGLYPFVSVPISEFRNQTLEIDAVIRKFSTDIENRLSGEESAQRKIELLEAYFVSLITPENIPDKEIYSLVNQFYYHGSDIGHFCDSYGVHPRTLERLFNKYVGLSPKLFKRLNRFQGVLKQIMHDGDRSLTSTAYDNDYYDQAHFINEFKSFAGTSPTRFLKEKKAVLQILDYR